MMKHTTWPCCFFFLFSPIPMLIRFFNVFLFFLFFSLQFQCSLDSSIGSSKHWWQEYLMSHGQWSVNGSLNHRTPLHFELICLIWSFHKAYSNGDRRMIKNIVKFSFWQQKSYKGVASLAHKGTLANKRAPFGFPSFWWSTGWVI